jgi:hypothetical protein
MANDATDTPYRGPHLPAVQRQAVSLLAHLCMRGQEIFWRLWPRGRRCCGRSLYFLESRRGCPQASPPRVDDMVLTTVCGMYR